MTANQQTLGFPPAPRKTRKARFLEQLNLIVPWAELIALIAPYYPPEGKRAWGGRPAYPLEVMLRIHLVQITSNIGDLMMEEFLYDVPLYRRFALLDGAAVMPDETTIMRFRHLLEKHNLAERVFALVNAQLEQHELLLRRGTIVDATFLEASSSTKNKEGQRDPEMHQAKKGEDIELWGDPECKRDVFYVKDCTQIVEKMLTGNGESGTYNIGNNMPVTRMEQIQGIIDVFGRKDKPSRIIVNRDKPNSPNFCLDISKTIEQLGYEPKYDYISFLKDLKHEMEVNRFEKLWGKESDYTQGLE